MATQSDQHPEENPQSRTLHTIDHQEIREWAERRQGVPSLVKETSSEGNTQGILRIDFPGYSGESSLKSIEWDEFFRIFEEKQLAFLYQEETKDGSVSRFSKFVSRTPG